tara:strand:+ start:337 stop:456 length:120 start_codon:yes stop_codon:yes gene_type:complete
MESPTVCAAGAGAVAAGGEWNVSNDGDEGDSLDATDCWD